MESVVRKSLNIREKCFEINSCPTWLLSILPNRIKSVESIVDNDNEQQSKINVDLSPYKLNLKIPILNQENLNHFNFEYSNFEYPNNLSFNNQIYKNYSQLIYSPSNQQLFYLFKQLKQFKENKKEYLIKIKDENKCKQINCLNKLIPLTEYCKKHLVENDLKQILFIKCNHCHYLSIKEDKNNILHFCSYSN